MVRLVLAVLLLTAPALALDEPVIWRDPDSGCSYWLAPQGGIAPRYRRDGLPDCPETNDVRRSTATPIISDQAIRDISRELSRGLDALKREMERLNDRLGRREMEQRR